jgi:hypothetical protein
MTTYLRDTTPGACPAFKCQSLKFKCQIKSQVPRLKVLDFIFAFDIHLTLGFCLPREMNLIFNFARELCHCPLLASRLNRFPLAGKVARPTGILSIFS